MKKSVLLVLLLGAALYSTTLFANYCTAGMEHCTKHTHKDTYVAPNGCNQLLVTITNDTNYYFSPDPSYPDASPSYGTITGSTSNTFPIINPKASRTIPLSGEEKSSSSKDEVNRVVRYVGYFSDPSISSAKQVGASFVINLSKVSCNASLTHCELKDRPCYCKGKTGGGCVESSDPCEYHSYCTYWENTQVVKECSREPIHFRDSYWNKSVTDCDKVTSASSLLSAVQFSDLYGVYTIDSVTPPAFTCSKSTVCDGSTNGNTPGKVAFTIQSSPIKTLTVTFPFHAESSLGKLMKDIVYHNVDPAYMEKLGIYYSMMPVSVSTKESSIAFSSLCNSPKCVP